MLWSAFLYWDSWIELSRFLCHPNKPSTFWHLRWTFFSFGKVTVYSKIKSKKLSIKGSKRISAKSTEKSLEQPFQMYTRRYITGRFIIRVKSYYPIHRGWHYSCTHYFFHHSNKKRFSKVQGFPNHLASFPNLWKSMIRVWKPAHSSSPGSKRHNVVDHTKRQNWKKFGWMSRPDVWHDPL